MSRALSKKIFSAALANDSPKVSMLCFHGMLGTRRTWGAFAPAFAAGGVRRTDDGATNDGAPARPHGGNFGALTGTAPIDVVCFDARNHGASFHDADHTLGALADDIHAAIVEEDARERTVAAAVGAAPTKRRIVLVGHSMCGAALLHFLVRRQQRLDAWDAVTAATPHETERQRLFSLLRARGVDAALQHVELAGAVVVDISPSPRPSMFTTLVRQMHRLEQVPLAQMATVRDVEKWLQAQPPPAPPPAPPSTLLAPAHLAPLAKVEGGPDAAPFPVPGPFLAKYFAANLTPTPHGGAADTGAERRQRLRWGCNLPVLSTAMRDGSISWEEQAPRIDAEAAELQSILHAATHERAPLQRVALPVHFVFGGASPYFVEVADMRATVDRYFARATIDVVPNAGHFVHIERPKAFYTSVARFLGECRVA